MRRTDGLHDLRSRPLVQAVCEQCDVTWARANAQAVAAQHSRKYHHLVTVEVLLLYRYGDPEPPKSAAPPRPLVDRLPKGHEQLAADL